jgi:pilus assembly protein CpaE
MFRLKIDAYPLDQITRKSLEVAKNDISLVRSRVNIMEGGIEQAIKSASEGFLEKDIPDLLIVQSDGSDEAVLKQLGELGDILSRIPGIATEVILVGTINNIEFYEHVMGLGIGKYLLSPCSSTSIIQGITSVFTNEKGSGERARIIAVVGAKGGVGSSTLSHNLAKSFEKIYQKPITLIDLDLHFGTVSINYSQDPRAGLTDALIRAGTTDVDEAMLSKFYTKDDDDALLWLLASNPSMKDTGGVLNKKNLDRVLEVASQMASYIVIDVPHIWNPLLADVLIHADETLIVSDPSIQGIRNTQMMFEALSPSKPHSTQLRYIINCIGIDKTREISVKDFTDTLGQSPIACFPWDVNAFRAAGSEGVMLDKNKKNKKIVEAFDELARNVSNKKIKIEEEKKPKGFWAGLFYEAPKKKK